MHIYSMGTTLDSGILEAIRKDWPLTVPEKCTEEQLVQLLAVEINQLINYDFSRLIAILYRIDISEPKLKILLAENKGSDAGRIIAWMIMERQKEKQRTRQEYRNRNEDIPEDEKW